MKNFLLSLSLLLTVGIIAASATPVTTPSAQVEKVFKKEFVGAEYVQWGEEEGYTSATFVLNSQRIQAWFSKSGELIGSIRGITHNQLPMLVTRSIQTRFSEPVMIEMTEVTNSEGTHYKVVLESKEKKYKVSIRPDGNIAETQKLKK